MTEVARIFTIGTTNRRDIVRRLMATSFLKGLTFNDAINAYRYYENNGLVKIENGYLVVYHICD